MLNRHIMFPPGNTNISSCLMQRDIKAVLCVFHSVYKRL